MVIMDRQDYINKANHLLNQNTYRSITYGSTEMDNRKIEKVYWNSSEIFTYYNN